METLLFTFNDADILNEVTKRTSFLGKSRGTETQAHLLDRLSLTEGEDFLFQEFLDDAVKEVFNWCSAFSRGIALAAWHKDIHTDAIDVNEKTIDFVDGYIVRGKYDTNNYLLEDGFTYDTTTGTIIPDVLNINRDDIILITNDPANHYYIAVRDCDSTNFRANAYDLGDTNPAGTVRFVFYKTDHYNESMTRFIERNLFSAIVNYIIFRWLEYVFPAEAKVFFDKFEENGQEAKNGLDSEDHVIVRPYTML